MKVTVNSYNAIAVWRWDLKAGAPGSRSNRAAAGDDAAMRDVKDGAEGEEQQAEEEDEEEEEEDDDDDDVCGICRVAYDGACPDCKAPGDGCPLSELSSQEALNVIYPCLTMPDYLCQFGASARTYFICIACLNGSAQTRASSNVQWTGDHGVSTVSQGESPNKSLMAQIIAPSNIKRQSAATSFSSRISRMRRHIAT